QGMSAVLGGTQSLHTNGMDEALGIPTEEAATLALRTQQLIAHETGITDTADPLAGSYFVEALTDEIEKRVGEYIERVDQMGGATQAIASQFFQKEIRDTAYRTQREIERGEKIIVGVNEFQTGEEPFNEFFAVDDSVGKEQLGRLREMKKTRRAEPVTAALEEVRRRAGTRENMMPAILGAVEAYATLGEIAHTLREVWGEYRE
ncbi:MAG: methylmalonyl-CoA mutase, partial [SAR324 cluster bacterium]|nr:methylmalonyl-CoA mutase [SAR324 cluster bacterium]